jgi:hypothetical protein
MGIDHPEVSEADRDEAEKSLQELERDFLLSAGFNPVPTPRPLSLYF